MTTTNPDSAASHRAAPPNPEGFRATVAAVANRVAAALTDVNEEPTHRGERSALADWLDLHRLGAATAAFVVVLGLLFLALNGFVS